MKLVPDSFEVPDKLETSKFRLRMLKITDVGRDYDAVMTSVDHLKGVFGPSSHWPSADLTLEQDLIDLGWHQKEFQRRTSFAYAVMNPDESRCLGCVYILGSSKARLRLKSTCALEPANTRVGLIKNCLTPLGIGLRMDGHSPRWPTWAEISSGIRGPN
jgi:hypothetical protein